MIAAIGSSRRAGPDRARLTALGRAIDRTAEAVEAVAWAWARHPIGEASDVLRALRDATRAARGTLLAGQQDVHLAAAAHDVLTYASLWLAAAAQLRAAVLRCSLE